MRKPAFCICENKGTEQLHRNREADQHLCFCYIDSAIPLLPKSEISSLLPSSVAVHLSLCRTWLETPDRFSHEAAHIMIYINSFFLFGLRLYAPVNNFSVMLGRIYE